MARYHIYCDESEQVSDNRYMVFAGIRIKEKEGDKQKEKDLSNEIFDKFKTLCHGDDDAWLNGEFKWSKISAKTIACYRTFFLRFARSADVYFACMAVNRTTDISHYRRLLKMAIAHNFIKYIVQDEPQAKFVIHIAYGKQVPNDWGLVTRINEYLQTLKEVPKGIKPVEEVIISEHKQNNYGIQIADLVAGACNYYRYSQNYKLKDANRTKKEMTNHIIKILKKLHKNGRFNMWLKKPKLV